MIHTAKYLAGLKSVNLDDLGLATTRNAIQFFGLDKPV